MVTVLPFDLWCSVDGWCFYGDPFKRGSHCTVSVLHTAQYVLHVYVPLCVCVALHMSCMTSASC